MMKTRKLNILQKLTALLFCLAIITQNGIEAPVLCFESDGHVNIEARCDVSCKVSIPINDIHQDDCNDCIDIHLWNYNSDLVFTIDSKNLENIDFEFIQPVILLETVSNQPKFHPIETDFSQLPPFLKTTILLI